MSQKAATAIAALRSRDTTEYRRTRAAKFDAEAAHTEAGHALGIDGEPHYRALRAEMWKAISPHRIEWRYGQEDMNGGRDVNGSDWTTGAHLSGEIWPEPEGGRYNMHMRSHIVFSLSPRDGDEFWRGVWLLKAAADAMAEGGL